MIKVDRVLAGPKQIAGPFIKKVVRAGRSSGIIEALFTPVEQETTRLG